MDASERVKTAPLIDLQSELTTKEKRRQQRHTIANFEPKNDGIGGNGGGEVNNDDVLALIEQSSSTHNSLTNESEAINDDNSLPEHIKDAVRVEFSSTFPMLAERTKSPSSRDAGSPLSKPKSPTAAGELFGIVVMMDRRIMTSLSVFCRYNSFGSVQRFGNKIQKSQKARSY